MFAAKHSLLNSLKGLSLHAEYYLPDGDLHFQVQLISAFRILLIIFHQVEQTIFRVHSYFFTRESPQFRERMAGAECARSSAHDGRTDQTAIPVKNTSVEDFSQLLWIFYNSCVMRTIYDLTTHSLVGHIFTMHHHRSGVRYFCYPLQVDGISQGYMHSPSTT